MKNKEQIAADYRKLTGKKVRIIILLALGLAGVFIWGMSVGGSDLGLGKVFQSIGDFFTGSENVTTAERYIALDIRVPRVIAGMVAGASLALSGLLMQGIFQNPLVSPYTLGISNAASFGACIAIVSCTGIASVIIQPILTPVLAFAFSVLAMLIVFIIAKFGGQSTKTLVLTGVAIGYLFASLVSLIKYIVHTDSLPDLVYWQMGSVANTRWYEVYIMIGTLAACFIISLILAWDLNIMTLGREEASALGVNFKRIQTVTFIMTTVLTGVTVSFTGVIGFVGLVAPHITRMIVGNDYRYCIPVSALFGGLLLLAADTLAKIVIAPAELPVGIITSLVGVPFYIFLVLRRNKNV